MGHRALVAYARDDDTFDLHYAHWGRNLASDIIETTPFGGPWDGPDATDVADHFDVTPRVDASRRQPTRVDPVPFARRVTCEEVLAAVETTIESLVVVSPTYEKTTYLVCSLDPGTDGTDLVLVRPDDDPEALRTWFVDAKSRLSGAVANGSVTRDAARVRLRRALARRARIYPPDDASFLRHG